MSRIACRTCTTGYTRPMAKTPMTVRGAELLRVELHRLKTVERPNVITAIAEARAHGDLSENAEYDAAKKRGSRKVIHAKRDGKFYRLESNPKASDGRFLLVELVRKPMRMRIGKLRPELGRLIADTARGAR